MAKRYVIMTPEIMDDDTVREHLTKRCPISMALITGTLIHKINKINNTPAQTILIETKRGRKFDESSMQINDVVYPNEVLALAEAYLNEMKRIYNFKEENKMIINMRLLVDDNDNKMRLFLYALEDLMQQKANINIVNFVTSLYDNNNNLYTWNSNGFIGILNNNNDNTIFNFIKGLYNLFVGGYSTLVKPLNKEYERIRISIEAKRIELKDKGAHNDLRMTSGRVVVADRVIGSGESGLSSGKCDMTALLIVAIILLLTWLVFTRPLFVSIAVVVIGYCYYTDQFAKNKN